MSKELREDTELSHYRILSKIGAGGMGEVYLAQDTKLDRKVALKILPAGVADDRGRMSRFVQEAKAASALNHPNILTIYEIDQADGVHFIATEFIDGETLRERMKSGSLKLGDVLDVTAQIASALAAAHEAGIVHRDIKPENVMLRRDGIVKVLDFGLAKLTGRLPPDSVDPEAPTSFKTEPGTVMGTAVYMSPEQARGMAVDVRTDIFSIGGVLYEMVAGCLPFAGSTSSEVMVSILSDKEPPPLARYSREVPAELERIVEKALRKDREERYQTTKDMLLDLRRLKHKLEVEAEIERTGPSEKFAVTASGSEVLGPMDHPSEVATSTSSAEYIVNQVKLHKRVSVLLLATLLLAIGGLAYFFYFATSDKAAINSVAVLPFVNSSNDPNAEYLSDGISEGLINSLSQLPQLKVIARSSTFKYKGKEIDPQEVANALGVRAIVTGRVVTRGDNLQISVEMVDARDKTQMWGEIYNRKTVDSQAVQAEMARTISNKLHMRLTGTQEQQLTKRSTENPEAYQLYLNGLFYFRKDGVDNHRKALDYFNQSVALDPEFALAWTGIADVYRWFGGNSMLDSREANAKAKAAVARALELDESLAEVHRALSVIKLNEWDWAGAEREFKRTIELDPNLPTAHTYYAHYLSVVMGRHAEALAEIKRAQELDPLSLGLRASEGITLHRARRYDEAIAKLQEVIRQEPDNINAQVNLGYTYAITGRYAEAIAQYQKSMSLDKENTSDLCYLGYALAMSGDRSAALVVLNKLKTTKEYVSPAELAILYIGLGDKEGALAELEKAYSAHDAQLQYLNSDAHHDSLRSDPRFTDLRRRVGLPQ